MKILSRVFGDKKKLSVNDRIAKGLAGIIEVDHELGKCKGTVYVEETYEISPRWGGNPHWVWERGAKQKQAYVLGKLLREFRSPESAERGRIHELEHSRRNRWTDTALGADWEWPLFSPKPNITAFCLHRPVTDKQNIKISSVQNPSPSDLKTIDECQRNIAKRGS